MKIPKKIKIGGHWLDIGYKSESKDRYDKSGSRFGWEHKLILQVDMPISKQESILLHEILHEIDFQHSLELSERQVATIAECLYQVITDNDLL